MTTCVRGGFVRRCMDTSRPFLMFYRTQASCPSVCPAPLPSRGLLTSACRQLISGATVRDVCSRFGFQHDPGMQPEPFWLFGLCHQCTRCSSCCTSHAAAVCRQQAHQSSPSTCRAAGTKGLGSRAQEQRDSLHAGAAQMERHDITARLQRCFIRHVDL